MAVRRFDHVGVVVDDLDAATAFFLGLEREGGGPVAGAWVDRVIDLDGVRIELVVVRTPDGHAKLELTNSTLPPTTPGRSTRRPTGWASGTSPSSSATSAARKG